MYFVQEANVKTPDRNCTCVIIIFLFETNVVTPTVNQVPLFP